MGNVHAFPARAERLDPYGDDARPPRDIALVHWRDITPKLDAEDFVQSLLIRSGMSVVYGQSNSGKTFWTSDLALHVATGRAWNGREVEQTGVLWIAMEGQFGIYNRVAAWRQRHGISAEHDVPFAIIPMSLNLLDPEADTGPLLAVMKDAGFPVGWVVIDTLSRAIAGGNENASEDMGAIVTNGARLQQEGGAHVTWIHHSGKDEAKGARGHSLLRAATDTEIEVTASEGGFHRARVSKQRELPCEGDFPFGLHVIEIGPDRRGKMVTSCVVKPLEGDAQSPKSRKYSLTPNGQLGLMMLSRALANGGAHLPPTPDYPQNTVAVSGKQWRQEFYSGASPGQDQATKQKAFKRASEELLQKGVVASLNDLVWVVGG